MTRNNNNPKWNTHFKYLQEENPSPIFQISLEGVLFYQNRACENIGGEWKMKSGKRLPKVLLSAFNKFKIKKIFKEEIELKINDTYYFVEFVLSSNRKFINAYVKENKYRLRVEFAFEQNRSNFRHLNKKEAMGKKFVEEFITDYYRDSVKEVMNNALKGIETHNYEFTLFTSKGDRVIILLKASARRNMNGKIIGFLVVGQDITELNDHKEKLEQQVVNKANGLNETLSEERKLCVRNAGFVAAIHSHESHTHIWWS